MQEIALRDDVGILVVINRPVSLAERVVRSRRKAVKSATIASRRSAGRRVTLAAVREGVLTVDVDVPSVIGPLLNARGWWFDVFADPWVIDGVLWALSEVNAVGAPTIAWLPTVSKTVIATDPSSLVFDSLDNWLLHPVLRRQAPRARRAYAELLPRADQVFASAPRSAEVLSEWCEGVQILPNGVDSAMFRKRLPRPADVPAGIIVGYAGKLAHRIDTELVCGVARQLPHVTFVFVGPVLDRRAVQPIQALSNVLFLGDRHYARLPGYLQHFDVAWIPHRVGDGESGGDPMKLYEYWAAGRPVVSSRIDGMDQWQGRVALIETVEAAVAAIERLLISPGVQVVPPEREWSAITDKLVQALAPKAP